MSKKISRKIAIIMLVLAVLFILIALSNPQASFPWSNTLTYVFYGLYFAVMIILFFAPFKKKE